MSFLSTALAWLCNITCTCHYVCQFSRISNPVSRLLQHYLPFSPYSCVTHYRLMWLMFVTSHCCSHNQFVQWNISAPIIYAVTFGGTIATDKLPILGRLYTDTCPPLPYIDLCVPELVGTIVVGRHLDNHMNHSYDPLQSLHIAIGSEYCISAGDVLLYPKFLGIEGDIKGGRGGAMFDQQTFLIPFQASDLAHCCISQILTM